jgi:hypothetical protein
MSRFLNLFAVKGEALGSVEVEALSYKLECRGVETR